MNRRWRPWAGRGLPVYGKVEESLQAWLGGGGAEFGAGVMEVWGGGLVFLLHWARALPHSPVASAKEENSDPEENGLRARGPHRACLSPVGVMVLAVG